MKIALLRVGIVAALLLCASQVAAQEVFRFRSGDLTIKVSPAIPGGDLQLSLGPFGELTWQTHTAPVDVRVGFLIRPATLELPDASEFSDIRFAFLWRKVPWILASGALIGALTLTRLDNRRRLAVVVGASSLGTALLALSVIGAAAFTFDAAALRNPSYRGPIKDAPRVLQLLKEVQRDWAGVQKNINSAVAGLQRLHDQIVTAGPTGDGDTVRLLVVSDLHNNPLGMLMASEIADRFGVAGVLDAGDFTDRGTDIEAELFSRFQRIGRPYIISPGNHEDQPTTNRLRGRDDVVILQTGGVDTADVEGILILGAEDPNSRSIDSDPDNAVAEATFPVRCIAFQERFATLRPQIVLVHNPRLSACAVEHARANAIPLVSVHGHDHQQRYVVDGSVITVDPGTSGANGFKSRVETDYGFALLEFDPRSRALVSSCLFRFEDPSRLRSSSCHIQPPPGSVAPASTSSPSPSPTSGAPQGPSPTRASPTTPSPS